MFVAKPINSLIHHQLNRERHKFLDWTYQELLVDELRFNLHGAAFMYLAAVNQTPKFQQHPL